MALTHSTGEAMALLENTREKQLRVGRDIAEKLIQETGEPTHTRAVRSAMLREGVFDHSIPEYWLGALFRSPRFAWTGEYFQVPAEPSDAIRNIHDRKTVKTWRLA